MIQIPKIALPDNSRKPVWQPHWKLIALFAVVLVVVATLVALRNTSRHIERERRDAGLLAVEKAHLQAARLGGDIHLALAAAHSLRSATLLTVERETDAAVIHDEIARVMIESTRNLHPDFAGVHVTLRPRAIPLPAGTHAEETRQLLRYYNDARYFSPYFRSDDDGELQYRSPTAPEAVDPEAQKHYAVPRDTLRPYVHEPYRTFEEGKPGWVGVGVTVPLVKPGGEFIGIAGIELKLDRLLESLDAPADFPFGEGFKLIISSEGALLPINTDHLDDKVYFKPDDVLFTRSRFDHRALPSLNRAAFPEITEALSERKPMQAILPVLKDGREALVAGVPIPLDGVHDSWMYLIAVPMEAIDTRAAMSVWTSLGTVSAAVGMALGIGLLLGRKVAGFLDARRRWFETILDRLPTPLVIRGGKNKEIQFINQAVEKRFGLENREVLIGQEFHLEGEPENPEDGPGEAIGEPSDEPIEFTSAGRSYRVQTSRVADDERNTFAILEVATDITEEKALARMISGLTPAANELDREAMNIADISGDVTDGVIRQSVELTQISKASEALAEKTGLNAESARKQTELSQKVCDKAESLAETAADNQQAMRRVIAASRNINTIIKLIDDVAFQAKILGINAMVEASRAGAPGRSFGVVATEVGELAARCAQAVRETTLQLEEGTAHVTAAEGLSARTVKELREIVEHAKAMKNYSALVAESAGEQSSSLIEVTTGIQRVSEELQKTSQNARQQAQVAETLKMRAVELRRLMNSNRRRSAVQN